MVGVEATRALRKGMLVVLQMLMPVPRIRRRPTLAASAYGLALAARLYTGGRVERHLREAEVIALLAKAWDDGRLGNNQP